MTDVGTEYFLDSGKVVGGKPADTARGPEVPLSRVLGPREVRVAALPVSPAWAGRREGDDIAVEVIREGPRVTGIRIQCPCGRHAQLDAEYVDKT